MKKLLSVSVAVLAGLALSLGALSQAGEAKKAQPSKERPKEEETTKVLHNVDLAHRLIDFGIATKSPAALLLASEILHENPVKDDPKLVQKAEGFEKPKGTIDEHTPKGLLAQAKAMAKDSEEYALLIKATESKLREKPRSPIGGYVSRRGHLHGGNSVSFFVHCHGHNHATVHPYNTGGHYVDLDIFVYDSYGNLVVQDRRTTSSARVHWDGHGDFRVVVQMYAGDHCDYHLVIN